MILNATITISAKYDSWNGGGNGPNSVNATKYVAKGGGFLLEDYGTFEDGTNDENVYKHLNWTVNNQDLNFGQSVKIESDIEITANFIRGIRLMVDVQNFYEQIGNDHYAVDMTSFNGTAYIRKNENDEITGVFVFKNQPFIFPKAMRTLTDGADWHDVEEWQYSNSSYTDEYASPGQTIILNDDVNMYSNFSIRERTN